MNQNQIEYEMQISFIELKSIESAFVKSNDDDDDYIEKISKKTHTLHMLSM